MTPRKPFSRSRNEFLATAGKAIAGNEDALKFGKDLFLRDALVGGDQPQDGVQRSDAQKSVGWDRHSLMTRIFRLQGKGSLGEGKALVPDQMQPDTAGGRIKGIKEVSSHGLIDRRTHRGPVIPLRHNRLREALGDIAAIHFLRHLKDQLLHGVTHNLLSGLNQPRTSFAMLHHSSASLRLRAN